jgi:hypothetical protein
MIQGASLAQAAARRQKFVTPGGALTFVSTYIGTNKMELLAAGRSPQDIAEGAQGPMAYLVEQAPEAVVEPHFHEVAQFQVFHDGSGQIGTHRLEGVTVHYAGPYSPYGPIAAGAQGVKYLTLRRHWDKGAQWMPGAAPVLRDRVNRKHVTFTSPPLERCADPGKLRGAVSTRVRDPAQDGAGAWMVQAGPGEPIPEVAAIRNARFWYVLAGTVQAEGRELDAGSCLYASESDGPGGLRAGAAGVEMILVQFAAQEASTSRRNSQPVSGSQAMHSPRPTSR